MSEVPKEKPAGVPIEVDDLVREDSWEEDQNDRGYYYDDAHGYEVYDPDSDEDELADSMKKPDDQHPAQTLIGNRG